MLFSGMNTVTRRDFIQYTSRYMKELPIVITNYGEPDLILSKYTPQKQDNVATPKYATASATLSKEAFNKYGCGCVRVVGQLLCKTHGRV